MWGVAGCATGDGTRLQPPTLPAPTSTLAEVPLSIGPENGLENGLENGQRLPGSESSSLTITLPWTSGEEMDSRFGCAGPGVSPAVAWDLIPQGTAEMALVISDQVGRIHWMLLGIDLSVRAIPDGVSSEDLQAQGVQVITNDFGETGWTPPCPAEGSSELFLFTVYALNQQIEGADTMAPAEIADLLGFVSIEVAEATGLYSRLS
jgi:Raf kinase inhibitor-like YbhB/YbcL family protein